MDVQTSIVNAIWDSGLAKTILNPASLAGVAISAVTCYIGSIFMDKLILQQGGHQNKISKRYPNVAQNVDLLYLLDNIQHFNPYAPSLTTFLADACEDFMFLYNNFSKYEKYKLPKKIKEMSDCYVDITNILNKIETKLCRVHSQLFQQFEPYKMEMDQLFDQLYQNIMMDYQLTMEQPDMCSSSDIEYEDSSDY